GYVPAQKFRPVVTRGVVSEYMDLLARKQKLGSTFDSLDISMHVSLVVQSPNRIIPPETMRAVVTAARYGRQMRASYLSISRPEAVESILDPHALVCTGNNWHVRAWCHSNREFRDFSLTRFYKSPE